jgi:hypothetical protein
MSTYTEHRRLKPALELVRKLDIGSNHAAEAIFDPGSAGFQIWCTPEDHPDDPEGWNLILNKLITGAFTKPCGFVASVCWKWEDEQIVGLTLETSAYALKDHLPEKFTSHNQPLNDRISIRNRPEDIAWATSKIKWLFAQSGPWLCPPIFVE